MRAYPHPLERGPARQRGIALVPALLFLITVAILGLAALSWTVMEERMVGNTKDRNLAFQAAEAGLRDAESDILQNLNAAAVFTSTCAAGLCTTPSTWPSPTSTDISQMPGIWSTPGLTRQYGQYTTVPPLVATPLPLVAAQPIYVIEKLSTIPASAGRSVALGTAPPSAGGTAYRVTALGTGARAETKVFLQSTYVVRDP
jgi:type IV pilus assembly protein PilX